MPTQAGKAAGRRAIWTSSLSLTILLSLFSWQPQKLTPGSIPAPERVKAKRYLAFQRWKN